MNEELIFERAVEIVDERKRREFIADSCSGDVKLIATVERLVAAHFGSGSFMVRPAAALPLPETNDCTENPSSAFQFEKPGDVVGPFQLVEEIGQGGMAIVFRAHQEIPIRRDVALKIIKPGLETRQIISRMQIERQVLAIMSHPAIAHVIDAGVTDSGRPYFAMELVQGIPITQFATEVKLSQRDKIELIIQACEALEHAHRRGIIHRDLKPSNLLVGRGESANQLKVIDFGIAKILGSTTEEDETVTRFGQIVGTPQFMSPEQATYDHANIDTRTDIYSLGAVLYQLLTGQPPIKADTTVDTLIRIKKQEPVPPSRLNKHIHKDLEAICLQCLQKDPARRYATAHELADDLRRFSENRPVRARKTSRIERLGKWIQRSPATAAFVGLTVLGLVALIGVWTNFTFQLRNQRDEIKETASQLELEKKLAQDNFDRAYNAIKQSLEIRSHTPLGSSESLRLNQELLETGLRFYDDLIQLNNPQDQLRTGPGMLGKIELERGKLYFEYGKVLLGAHDFSNSVTAFETCNRICEQLAETFSKRKDPSCLRLLGASNLSLAKTLLMSEQPDRALERATAGLKNFESLADQKLLDRGYQNWYFANAYNRIAEVQFAKQEYERSSESFRRALEFGAQLPAILDYQYTLASSRAGNSRALRMSGHFAEAESEINTAIEIIEDVCIRSTNSQPLYEMARANYWLESARVARDSNCNQEAMEKFGRAIDLQSELSEQQPNIEQIQLERAAMHDERSDLYGVLNDPENAAKETEKALTIRQKIDQAAFLPDRLLLNARMRIGFANSAIEQLQLPRAIEHYDQALTILRKIDTAYRPSVIARLRSGLHYKLGAAHFQIQQYDQAAIHLEEYNVLSKSPSPQVVVQL